MPGDNTQMTVGLLTPIAMDEGVAVCDSGGRAHRGGRASSPKSWSRGKREVVMRDLVALSCEQCKNKKLYSNQE